MEETKDKLKENTPHTRNFTRTEKGEKKKNRRKSIYVQLKTTEKEDM